MKQGDHLSPTLFIIAAKVLTKGLNKLHEMSEFKVFGLPKWSPQVNHLVYTDDTILFCSGDKKIVRLMMSILGKYEQMSGQLINRNKNFFYLHKKTPMAVEHRLRKWTGIVQGKFSFTYVGYPIYYRRKKISYFENIITKVNNGMWSWHNRTLSFGGRYILIESVL